MIDTFACRIVGWRVSTSAHASFVLDALGRAVHERRPAKGLGLVHHSDRGSEYLSIKCTERLAEVGTEPSVGSVGDSYDNALAEDLARLDAPATQAKRTAAEQRLRLEALRGRIDGAADRGGLEGDGDPLLVEVEAGQQAGRRPRARRRWRSVSRRGPEGSGARTRPPPRMRP